MGIDEQTPTIRAAEFTTGNMGEAPMPPELLDRIPPGQQVASGAAPSWRCTHRLSGNGRCLRQAQVS